MSRCVACVVVIIVCDIQGVSTCKVAVEGDRCLCVVVLTNVLFSLFQGGAILFEVSSGATLTSCEFTNNSVVSRSRRKIRCLCVVVLTNILISLFLGGCDFLSRLFRSDVDVLCVYEQFGGKSQSKEDSLFVCRCSH